MTELYDEAFCHSFSIPRGKWGVKIRYRVFSKTKKCAGLQVYHVPQHSLVYGTIFENDVLIEIDSFSLVGIDCSEARLKTKDCLKKRVCVKAYRGPPQTSIKLLQPSTDSTMRNSLKEKQINGKVKKRKNPSGRNKNTIHDDFYYLTNGQQNTSYSSYDSKVPKTKVSQGKTLFIDLSNSHDSDEGIQLETKGEKINKIHPAKDSRLPPKNHPGIVNRREKMTLAHEDGKFLNSYYQWIVLNNLEFFYASNNQSCLKNSQIPCQKIEIRCKRCKMDSKSMNDNKGICLMSDLLKAIQVIGNYHFPYCKCLPSESKKNIMKIVTEPNEERLYEYLSLLATRWNIRHNGNKIFFFPQEGINKEDGKDVSCDENEINETTNFGENRAQLLHANQNIDGKHDGETRLKSKQKASPVLGCNDPSENTISSNNPIMEEVMHELRSIKNSSSVFKKKNETYSNRSQSSTPEPIQFQDANVSSAVKNTDHPKILTTQGEVMHQVFKKKNDTHSNRSQSSTPQPIQFQDANVSSAVKNTDHPKILITQGEMGIQNLDNQHSLVLKKNSKNFVKNNDNLEKPEISSNKALHNHFYNNQQHLWSTTASPKNHPMHQNFSSITPKLTAKRLHEENVKKETKIGNDKHCDEEFSLEVKMAREIIKESLRTISGVTISSKSLTKHNTLRSPKSTKSFNFANFSRNSHHGDHNLSNFPGTASAPTQTSVVATNNEIDNKNRIAEITTESNAKIGNKNYHSNNDTKHGPIQQELQFQNSNNVHDLVSNETDGCTHPDAIDRAVKIANDIKKNPCDASFKDANAGVGQSISVQNIKINKKKPSHNCSVTKNIQNSESASHTYHKSLYRNDNTEKSSKSNVSSLPIKPEYNAEDTNEDKICLNQNMDATHYDPKSLQVAQSAPNFASSSLLDRNNKNTGQFGSTFEPSSTCGGSSVEIENDSILRPSDKNLVSDFVFLIVAQLQQFQENSDNESKQGLPGLRCRHCAETRYPFKLYPKKARHLRSFIQNSAQAHIMSCHKVPKELKEKLTLLQDKRTQEYTKIPASSVDVFFSKIWENLKSACTDNGSRVTEKSASTVMDSDFKSMKTEQNFDKRSKSSHITLQSTSPQNVDDLSDKAPSKTNGVDMKDKSLLICKVKSHLETTSTSGRIYEARKAVLNTNHSVQKTLLSSLPGASKENALIDEHSMHDPQITTNMKNDKDGSDNGNAVIPPVVEEETSLINKKKHNKESTNSSESIPTFNQEGKVKEEVNDTQILKSTPNLKQRSCDPMSIPETSEKTIRENTIITHRVAPEEVSGIKKNKDEAGTKYAFDFERKGASKNESDRKKKRSETINTILDQKRVFKKPRMTRHLRMLAPLSILSKKDKNLIPDFTFVLLNQFECIEDRSNNVGLQCKHCKSAFKIFLSHERRLRGCVMANLYPHIHVCPKVDSEVIVNLQTLSSKTTQEYVNIPKSKVDLFYKRVWERIQYSNQS